ncbi:glycoside hydrolase family 3 N-terminal domain-containing protein [Asticcacaulis sp.]|uniref:glycoside hydrolase family 3 N-terminal domain-containing protein n=1 Tax=Asticcacaulis sp. TaxID=1872648 RepID=UPI002CE46ED4|nr:glycoside hydrolase family 3 N-terminal domain-containing protein [Asticcacaulis sp.]HTM81524.1 glycoside hydrolase family 3 N-terminal domain-containing protein [Asticcacaulis sp.]
MTAITTTRRAFTLGMGISSLALVLGAATRSQAKVAALYKNASAPVVARVDDLISRMTLEEKVMQMQSVWENKSLIQDDKGTFISAKASKAYPHSFGMIALPYDYRGVAPEHAPAPIDGHVVTRNARQTALQTNAIQKWAREETRLGIPVFMHEEGLHGYLARDATSFPQAIGLASSFDPGLVTRIFSVVAGEMRARGGNIALTPVVDVARDPRWGRIEETYGEDPHLCGEIGKAAVLGFQGTELPLAKGKVYATLKHFAGHGQPENGTNAGPAEISERILREDILPPFEKIVKETNLRSVMPSYNEIDGVPSHANTWLLKTILRGEWDYKGMTVSDYFGIKEINLRHKLAPDFKEAAWYAIKAGVDIELPDGAAYPNLVELVKSGRISEAEIDAPVRRLLELKFLAGLFENPFVDTELADALTATPGSVALAREAATRTAVLLKNEKSLLPLDGKKVGKMLVLGHYAQEVPLGCYSDVPRHLVSVLDGLKAEGKASGFDVIYKEGVRITEPHIWQEDKITLTPPETNAKLIAEAVEAAKNADTIVMVLGDNEQTSREAYAEAHLGDRQSLDLIGQQNDLAKAIFDLGKPTVVLLLNGRPMSVNLLAERADALIEGWYMGQETGNAFADLLFGRANPGAKLPVSIARNVGQLPIFYNYKPTARRGYLDGETKPLYPFGFGLSYTTFEISTPRLSKTIIAVNDSVSLSVDVKNTGTRSGDEVVQIYIRDDFSSVTRPVLELKHFDRVTLQPGESRTLTFEIKPSDLWFYNTDMERVVEPGTFTIHAGPNSVDLKSTILTVA